MLFDRAQAGGVEPAQHLIQEPLVRARHALAGLGSAASLLENLLAELQQHILPREVIQIELPIAGDVDDEVAVFFQVPAEGVELGALATAAMAREQHLHATGSVRFLSVREPDAGTDPLNHRDLRPAGAEVSVVGVAAPALQLPLGVAGDVGGFQRLCGRAGSRHGH